MDSTSDHFALLVSDSFTPRHPRKCQFHFEAMLDKKRECRDIIEAAWENSRNQNTHCGSIARYIDGSMGREINKLRREINDLLDSEEVMWQQRAKVQWLGLGDRNMKYFHSKALRGKRPTYFWVRPWNHLVDLWCRCK